MTIIFCLMFVVAILWLCVGVIVTAYYSPDLRVICGAETFFLAMFWPLQIVHSLASRLRKTLSRKK